MLLELFISLLEFSSGERLTILGTMRDVAAALGFTSLVQHLDRAIAHEQKTREMDNRWARRMPGRVYTEEVLEIDNLVDPVLKGIRDISAGHVRGLPSGHERAARVGAMLKDIYPAGLLAVVSLPFVDQVAATEVILNKLRTTHATLVAELGLEEQVEYLAELTLQYREAVNHGRTLTFAEVEAMRQQGQLYLREAIAMVLGRFADSSDPDNVARRTELLEPVVLQTRLVRLRRARRRPAGSENPDDTGETPDGTGETPDGTGETPDSDTTEILDSDTSEFLDGAPDPAENSSSK